MNTHSSPLASAVRQLAQDFDHGLFVPLLEADVDSYLLHILLDQRAFPASQLHQNARVVGLTARRYDLVVGAVEFRPASGQRAAVSDPVLVVQGKFFPRWGFTSQQQNVHLGHVIQDDIPSLGELRRRWPNAAACALLVDLYISPNLRGYLSGKLERRRRVDTLVEQCRAAGATLLWVHPSSKDETSVDVFTVASQERY